MCTYVYGDIVYLYSWFIPRSMMESVIVPVIKNKNKRINDKGDYRPICLSTVCSKIVEMALARRLSDFL